MIEQPDARLVGHVQLAYGARAVAVPPKVPEIALHPLRPRCRQAVIAVVVAVVSGIDAHAARSADRTLAKCVGKRRALGYQAVNIRRVDMPIT